MEVSSSVHRQSTAMQHEHDWLRILQDAGAILSKEGWNTVQFEGLFFASRITEELGTPPACHPYTAYCLAHRRRALVYLKACGNGAYKTKTTFFTLQLANQGFKNEKENYHQELLGCPCQTSACLLRSVDCTHSLQCLCSPSTRC